MKSLAIALSLGALLMMAGCNKEPASTSPQYEIRGKITALDAAAAKVTIDHEDIPGLMQAMEMEFKTASPAVFEGLRAGDAVQGHLESRDGEYVIIDLRKS